MKKLILLSLLLINVSCINLELFKTPLYKLSEKEREKNIEKVYKELDNKYYALLEDEIKEKERLILEKQFDELLKELQILKTNSINKKQLKSSTKEHREFIDNYLKRTSIKVQYLKDLQ